MASHAPRGGAPQPPRKSQSAPLPTNSAASPSAMSMNSPPPSPPPNNNLEDDKFAAFEHWLKSNGAQFPLLELRQYDAPPQNTNANDRRRQSAASEENDAEEKKDGGLQDNLPDNLPSGELADMGDMSLRSSSSSSAVASATDDDGSGEMRGVHATAPIPPHTVCVAIPRACLITVEMGQNTPVGRKILASDVELDAPKHIFLMVYLLWDRKLHGKDSFFAPYYDILPKTLRNMPLFWTDDELRGLEGSHLLVQVADRAAAIREDYLSICALAPEFASLATLAEFRWARMIVCSRNFGLVIHGHRTSALVPHADMLNHYRPRETKWTFCEETQCFTITTLRGIGAGQQVYDSYGQKCNHRFLLNYGFCVENNVEIDGFCPNEVPLELGMELTLEGREMMGLRGSSNNTGNGGGEENAESARRSRELFEKKLAFWARGEAAASHPLFHDLYGGGGGGASSGGSNSAGSSFHALAAAVAGASSARTAASAAATTASSPSHDIATTVAAMTDPSTSAALAEAVAGIGGPSISSSNIAAPPPPLPPRPTLTHCPVKRVRVCASNNENTRILFSMLRVLACDGPELDRLLRAGGRLGRGGTAAPLHSGGPPTVAQRLLFGAPPAGAATAAASGAPPGSTALRTCRDVRHPLSLRNERRALGLLLEIAARSLSRYPTSLARDRADLADEAAFPRYSNARHAKLQVAGEKEVLHHFALWARTGMHVIDIIATEVAAERRRAIGGGDMANVPPNNEELGFDCVVQAMEDDDDCAATIVRYCADVLGAVRREELHRIGAGARG